MLNQVRSSEKPLWEPLAAAGYTQLHVLNATLANQGCQNNQHQALSVAT
jgi:hypothetical protein